MAYFLRGIIAKNEQMESLRTVFPLFKSSPLHQDFELVPITDELFDEMYPDSPVCIVDEFEYLTEEMEQAIIEASHGGGIAYIESDVFGDEGGHTGIVWDGGERIYEGPFELQTMNAMLRLLRVRRERPDLDEFVSIGLDLCRSTEEWVAAGVR